MNNPEEIIKHAKYIINTLALFKKIDKTQMNISSSISNYNIPLNINKNELINQIFRSFIMSKNTLITFIEETDIRFNNKNIYKTV